MGHISKLGQRLNNAVDAYNSAVGSLERQVMPQARRFPELGVTSDAPLPPLEPVGQLVRKPSGTLSADVPSPDAAPATASAQIGLALPEAPETEPPAQKPAKSTDTETPR